MVEYFNIAPKLAALPPDKQLSEVVRVIVMLLEGEQKIEKETALKLGPYAGREVILAHKEGPVVLRVYVGDNRIHTLMAGGKAEDVKTFVESFKILAP